MVYLKIKIKHPRAGMPEGVSILLDTGDATPVSPMRISSRSHAGGSYHESTFPVALAYAMSGHASRGATGSRTSNN
eukprot:366130-Chlamydomonas_euryale.AAC.35